MASLSSRGFVALLVIQAGSLAHSRRGHSAERRPRAHAKKRPFALQGQPTVLVRKRPLCCPFQGSFPVRLVPGASLDAVPPSTMAEAFGLKCCSTEIREHGGAPFFEEV